MTPREIEEYRALRDTIRERGTVRAWLVPAGVVAWGALAILVLGFAPWPAASLFPLMTLAVTYESVFALHTGVERVGRYLQVFYEDDESARAWEHQAMAYGRTFPGSSPDPLYGLFFFVAALLNFVIVVVTDALVMEYVAMGALHLLFLARLVYGRQQAGRQRAVDLERFRQLKGRV